MRILRKIYSFSISFLVITYSYCQVDSKKAYERLSSSEQSHKLQNSPSGVSKIDVNSLIVIDKSGDAAFSIPIVNVKSRKMELPIQVNYQAGIKVDQKASEVGLGWSINFGSIVRDYGAFEPDYAETSAETKMTNVNGVSGAGSLTHAFADKSPVFNNKDLVYQGTNNMTPDNYHINIPGRGNNTFWNNGAEGGSHNFVLSDYQPWKIEHTSKIYTVYQEYSRINEINFSRNNTNPPKLSTGNNIAAAICIPPYVHDRDFRSVALPTLQGTGTSYTVSTVKYKDIAEFIITVEDGTQYVFGKALRGQKYLFTEDPFWSTMPSVGSTPPKAVYGEWWKIDYIAEWLLTEVRSADFVDKNENSIADDGDSGDWIRIEYTEPTQIENVLGGGTGGDLFGISKVPKHREWQSFTQTDRVSSLMRERAYVTKIITPVQEIDFDISQRYDVDHDYFKIPANNPDPFNPYIYSNVLVPGQTSYDAMHIYYPVEIMKYDKITVKERLKEDNLYSRDKVLNTIIFNYAAKGSAQELAVSNYLIRNNNNQETVSFLNSNQTLKAFNIENYYVGNKNGRGKTTLLGIDFFPGDNIASQDKQSFKFEYGYNPSFDEIHKYEITKAYNYPAVRQSKVLQERFPDASASTSILPYSAVEVSLNSDNINITATPENNAALKDEMGYFYKTGVSNNGRHAWSMSKIIIPAGGKIEMEYERDDFDYKHDVALNSDRKKWKDNGSLVDDRLPFISHYNELAHARSMVQSRINNINNNYVKKLYRAYHLPMNNNSGGLRLKKKKIDDGINPVMEVQYQYGTGHYTAVPASYWQNYIEGFSSFLQKERIRQEGNAAYDPGWLGLAEPAGFYENDFSTYMSYLSLNTRIDNTVNDNHYYEFIDEIYMDNTSNNPKTRNYYGDPNTSGGNYYEGQKNIFIKGYDRFDKALTEAITNNVNNTHQIKLLKTEKYEAGISSPYETVEYQYGLSSKFSNSVSYSSKYLGAETYPTYTSNGSGVSKIYMFNPPSGFDLATSSITDFLTRPVNDDFSYVNDYILAYINSNLKGVQDNDYNISGNTFKRQESVLQNLTKRTHTYKGITTQTDYSYEATYGLLRSEKTGNSKRNYNGSLNTEEIITDYKYAFESYSSLSSVFTGKNMLSQKTEVNTFLNSNWTIIPPQTRVKSSIQSWTLNGNNNVPYPKDDYIFNEGTNTVTGLAGLMDSYTNFNYAGSNVSNWQLRENSREYNRFGQMKFYKNADIFTRNVLGYNSSLTKATISFPDKWFDATYTGFEDLYEDLENLTLGTSEYDEFWYDENLSYSLIPGDKGFVVFLRFVTNPPSPLDIYIDNYNNSFSIGDKIKISANPFVTSVYSDNGFALCNPPDFESTITDIQLISPSPIDGFANYYGIFLYQPVVEMADWSKYDYKITLADPVPILNYNSSCGFINGAIIEKVIEDNRISEVTSEHARTGEYSYRIATRKNSGDPSQKSPVRPVKIKGESGSSPSQMNYIASVWVTQGQPVYSNGTTGNNESSYRIMSTLGQPLPEEQKKQMLLVSSPLTDDVLVAMMDEQYKLSPSVIGEVLIAQPGLSEDVLAAMLKKPHILPSCTIKDILQNVISKGYGLSEEVLNTIIKRWPLFQPGEFRDILISASPLPESAQIQLDKSPLVSSKVKTALSELSAKGNVLLVYKLWNEDRTTLISQESMVLKGINQKWKYYEMEIPVSVQSSVQYLDVYVENDRLPIAFIGAPDKGYLDVFADDMIIYPQGAKYSYSSFDKFLNPSYVTDANDNTLKSEFDQWGRPGKEYNANNELLKEFEYYTTNDIASNHNFVQARTLVNQNQFSYTRQYFDGVGRLKQTVTTEPSKYRKMINSFDYDNRGRLVKEYNALGAWSPNLDGKIYSNYAADLNNLFGSPYVYNEIVYKAWPGTTVAAINHARLTTDPVSGKTVDNTPNATADISYSGITYPANELIKEIFVDEEGNQSEVFKDKLGRVIAQRTPIGNNYSFDGTGNIIWGTGNYQYATTYFEYDAAGNLIRTIDPEGLQTSYEYSSTGQVLKETHSDKGITEYRYDKFGRLRFIRDANDKKDIEILNVADQFTFNRYDKWSRIIETGKWTLPVFMPFLNQLINNIDFPQHNQYRTKVYKQFIYDGPKSENAVNRIYRERVLGNHILVNNVPEPADIDEFVYSYNKNGLLETKTFNISGLPAGHRLKYIYNRLGLVERTSFFHSSNSNYNFIESNYYDDLGRIALRSSGRNIGLSTIDAKFQYDALGNLKKKSLAYNNVFISLYADNILYQHDIRGRLNSQLAKNFRYELSYDKRDNITRQLWSNNYFDNKTGNGGNEDPVKTASSTYSRHQYDYYYDPMSRLTGANYSLLATDNDPYNNYNYFADNNFSDFNCSGIVILSDPLQGTDAIKSTEAFVKSFKEAIFLESSTSQFEPETKALSQYLLNLTEKQLVKTYTLNGGINSTLALTVIPSIDSLALFAEKDIQNAQLVADEISLAINLNDAADAEKLSVVSAKITATDTLHQDVAMGLYEKKTFEEIVAAANAILQNAALNNSEKLSQLGNYVIQKQADLSNSGDIVTLMKNKGSGTGGGCVLNPPAVSIYPVSTPPVNPVVTQTNIYDEQYYYTKSGNFTKLKRFDNTGEFKQFTYSYIPPPPNETPPPVNNQLRFVSVFDGSSITTPASGLNYDANGNLLNDQPSGISSFSYNIFNMPEKIIKTNGDIVNYRYDINNMRSVKLLPSGEREYYIGGVIIDGNNIPGRYSFTDGFAELTSTNSLVKKYVVHDWLGTSRMVINKSSGIVSSHDHYPYGKLMPQRILDSDNEGKRFQFTGHEFDQETAFEYHGFRYYNRELGRYMTVDPKIIETWSTYAYANGNPVNITDPNGDCPPGTPCWQFQQGVATGVIQGATSTVTGLWNAVTSPIETGKAIGNAIVNYDQTWEGIKGAAREQYNKATSGNPRMMGEVVGGAVFVIAEAAVGTKGLTKLGSFGKVAKTADVVEDAANVARGVLKYEQRTLQHMFSRHAKDFGVTDNWSKAAATEFEGVLKAHTKGIKPIQGTYRGTQEVLHYFNPETGLNVMTDLEGNLVGGWKLSADQIKYLQSTGTVK